MRVLRLVCSAIVPLLFSTVLGAPGFSQAQQLISGAPSVIMLSGVIDGRKISAERARTAAENWQWTENNTTFNFRTVVDNGRHLVIYDASRDIYHKLNLGPAWHRELA